MNRRDFFKSLLAPLLLPFLPKSKEKSKEDKLTAQEVLYYDNHQTHLNATTAWTFDNGAYLTFVYDGKKWTGIDEPPNNSTRT